MSERLLEEVLKYESKILRFYSGQNLTREESEDLKQETLCRIYESLPGFRGASSLGTWIYGICRNVLFEHRRRRIRTVPIGDEEIPVPDKTDYIDFQSLVDSLPQYLKPIYMRRFKLDMPVKEIADQLLMPEGTVKYYLHQIRKHLRDMI